MAKLSQTPGNYTYTDPTHNPCTEQVETHFTSKGTTFTIKFNDGTTVSWPTGYELYIEGKDFFAKKTVDVRLELEKALPEATVNAAIVCPLVCPIDTYDYAYAYEYDGLTATKPKKYNVLGIAIHLNDWHKMKREDIADWLESTDLDLKLTPTTNKEKGGTHSD